MTTTLRKTIEMPQQTIQDFLIEIAESDTPATGAAVSVEFRAEFAPAPAERPARNWLEFTTKALIRLPWEETNLPDGATPPQPGAAAALLRLLSKALDDDTPAPTSITTTWLGGITAEWHINRTDLEITCQPSGAREFYFARFESNEEASTPIEQDEGIIEADLTKITGYARALLQ